MRMLAIALVSFTLAACSGVGTPGGSDTPLKAEIAAACASAAQIAPRVEARIPSMSADELARVESALVVTDRYCSPGAAPPTTRIVLLEVVNATLDLRGSN